MNRSNIKNKVKGRMSGITFEVIGIYLLATIITSAASVFGIPIEIGLMAVGKDILLGQKYTIETLFIGYKNLDRAVNYVALRLLIGLLVGFGFILFIVPGIIWACMYSQAHYIYASTPNITIGQAMQKSKDMMMGHKGEYFVFGLSFIGHFLLCIITFGLWSLYLIPYMGLCMLEYYEVLSGTSRSY